MKRSLLLTACLLLAIFSSSCGKAAQDTSLLAPGGTQSPAQIETPQEKKYTIALVMKTLTNPFFVEMEKGARRAEKEFNINLIVKTGAQETSIDQQITIIEELIRDGVDAILIAPADSVQLIPVLKKAQDAGIVIINIDNQLDLQSSEKIGLIDVPYISVDNEQGAYLSASYISGKVDVPTQAIILEGIVTAKNAQDRKNGALRAFGENKNIQVVASETANWKIDEAYNVATKLFEEHPDVKLVFCANDMMAFGVIQYLQENNKAGVQVAAYDALEEAMPMLKNGSLEATIDQQAAIQAYTGVQYAIQALKGEELPPVTLLAVLLVTKENAK
ncbi:MAG: sugar ABC transporter substrate-binding protein [Anaerolineales bacterium]|nr:sugar ABC transporter substrate-binding protein [Anaerolineales bacterium]